MRAITAKYRGTCEKCGGAIEPGFSIFWHGRGRVSHAHLETCNEVYAMAEADKHEAAARSGEKMWAEAGAALAAGLEGEEDAEVLNAWRECEGHNPWGRDLDGDPGTLMRLAYKVCAAAGDEAKLAPLREAWAIGRAMIAVTEEGRTHPEGIDMERLGCLGESMAELMESKALAEAKPWEGVALGQVPKRIKGNAIRIAARA